MALWLVRTGRHGQFEQQCLADSRIYLTWGGIDRDLGQTIGDAPLLNWMDGMRGMTAGRGWNGKLIVDLRLTIYD